MTSHSDQPLLTRKLVFHSEELGEDATLIFLFDEYDGKHDAPITSHPVVWKKAFFGKTGNYSKTLEYTNLLTFTKPDPGDLKFHFPASGLALSTLVAFNAVPTAKVVQKKVPYKTTWSRLRPKRNLALRRTENGNDFKLSDTEDGTGLVLKNESGEKVDAVLGFQERPGNLPQFVRVFRNVGVGRPVSVANFKPILRVYVTSAYEEDEVLLEATSGRLVWFANLDALAEKSEWKVSYDFSTGNFVIGQTA